MSRLWPKFAAFFQHWRSSSTVANDRVYAVGDVHGRLDLFRQLLNQVEADARSQANRPSRIILLGDLIDRGPQSSQMLEFARAMQLQNRGRVVVLCGNHEDMLIASADGNADAQRLWLANGGDATLKSYGLDLPAFIRLSPEERGRALRDAVGLETLRWLKALPSAYRTAEYFFCHAGVRPGIALDEQRREDLLWIRREFLESSDSHGAVIVHGHSETQEVEVRPNRINVDTSAYRSGELTAVGLQGPYKWFISTARKCLTRSDFDATLRLGAAAQPGKGRFRKPVRGTGDCGRTSSKTEVRM